MERRKSVGWLILFWSVFGCWTIVPHADYKFNHKAEDKVAEMNRLKREKLQQSDPIAKIYGRTFYCCAKEKEAERLSCELHDDHCFKTHNMHPLASCLIFLKLTAERNASFQSINEIWHQRRRIDKSVGRMFSSDSDCRSSFGRILENV